MRKSFFTCGISNALDGTEEAPGYEEEQDNDAEEDEMDEEVTKRQKIEEIRNWNDDDDAQKTIQ